MLDDKNTDPDFLDELIQERSEKNPAFPTMVNEAHMSRLRTRPKARYEAICAALLDSAPNTTGPSDGAEPARGFGSSALKINNKIFAMLSSNERFVVKLPRKRVDELIASGNGERFDPGHGRLMKEWLSLEPTSELDWLTLAREAMEFVAAKK